MAITTREQMSSIVSVVYQTGAALDQGDLQTIVDVFRGVCACSPDVVRITALSVEPYIAQTLTAVDRIAQTVTAGELIEQTVTWEDSEL